MPLVLGNNSFGFVVDEEERSALVACGTAANEVHGFASEVQRAEDVLIAPLSAYIINQEVSSLSDGTLLRIHDKVAVVLQDMLVRFALLLHVVIFLLLFLPFPIGAADQSKDLVPVFPNVVNEHLHIVHVVQRNQRIGHMYLSLHLCVALQTYSRKLDHFRLLHLEPYHLGVIVGLDDGQLAIFNFFIMDENRGIIFIILVVVVGEPKAILIGIFMFHDAEVLGIVEGEDVDGVAIVVVELMVDVSDCMGLQVDEVDGGVRRVEDDDFLLAEHAEPADYTGKIIAVDHLSFRVNMNDGF